MSKERKGLSKSPEFSGFRVFFPEGHYNQLPLIFPAGFGSQYASMGRELIDDPKAKKVFREASDILGYSVDSLINSIENQDCLYREIDALPLVFILNHAYYQLIKDKRHPKVLAGYDIGFFNALVASGAISFKDGLRLVRTEAEAITAMDLKGAGSFAMSEGSETKTGILREVITDLEKKEIFLAAEVSDNQVIMSGLHLDEKRESLAALRNRGLKVEMLRVNAPHHTQMMEPVRKALEKEMEKIEIKNPRIPIISNITGQSITTPEEIRKEILNQIIGKISWRQTGEIIDPDGDVSPFLVRAKGVLSKASEDKTVKVAAFGVLGAGTLGVLYLGYRQIKKRQLKISK